MEDAKDPDMFASLTGDLYVIVNSRKDKGKVLKEHILKDIIPRGFDVRLEGIQQEHHQRAAQFQQAIHERDNRIQAIQYENVGLQGKIRVKDQQIAALQRRYVGYLANEDKNNGITIIAKNNETAEYSYISMCGQHGYRKHKVRVFLAHNQGSTLFADGDTPNAIVTYNFWREHMLIVFDPNRPRHFRLEMIN